MRIEDGDRVSASRQHLVFAYYVTGHGFGHATRVVEVVRHLILAGHDVHVVSAAPDFVFTSEVQSPRLFIRKVLLDRGAVQADALTVDRLASLERYDLNMYSETAVVPRASILATEIEWLNSIKADLVVSDVVPVACGAAADAGIRSVCVTNFSWDFIYAEYVMAAGNHHRSVVWQVAQTDRGVLLTQDKHNEVAEIAQELKKYCVTEPLKCPLIFGGKLNALDDKWIQVVFEPPKLRLGALEIQYGDQSEVELEITYIDDKVRLGKGSRVSIFVFEGLRKPSKICQNSTIMLCM